MKKLLLLLCFLPSFLLAQDTLVAEITILRTPQGIEISYSKDMSIPDKQIAEFLLEIFTFTLDTIKPPEIKTHEDKIKKI